MIGSFARVLAGFLLACLSAGVVQVLFVVTPEQLLEGPANVFVDRAGETGVLALLAATHAAIFSIAFALIVAGIGEWIPIRSPFYYIGAGAGIALLGFAAQFASEVAGQPTVFNPYAITAFLTSGALAGLVYWLIAGNRAGGSAAAENGVDATSDTDAPDAPPPKSWKDRPRLVVEDNPAPTGRLEKRSSLTKRLADQAEALGTEQKTGAQAPPAPVEQTDPAKKA